MNHRLTTIFATKTYAADATEIIDINLSDPVSAFLFVFQMHASTQDSMTLHPMACISKVELVDGSDVLFSLTGLEMEALDWYNHKSFRFNENFALIGNYVVRRVGINFGRFLWDPMFAFDPSKFKNPQLKITVDLDGGGQTPTYVKVAVHALCFDEKIVTPLGFFMSKEIKNYVPAAAGHEYTDLPTDFPYRKLLIKCQTAGSALDWLLSNIKLSEEQDKRVVFDQSPTDIMAAIMAEYPPVEESYYFACTGANTYLMIAPTFWVASTAAVWREAYLDSLVNLYSGNGGRLKTWAGPATANYQIHVRGWLPHGVIAIPFGDQNDPDDWYDVTKIGSLKADITAAGAATGGFQICLEQLRAY